MGENDYSKIDILRIATDITEQYVRKMSSSMPPDIARTLTADFLDAVHTKLIVLYKRDV